MTRTVLMAEVSGGTGTRETEVRLDGWCEGGLRQQRNDGGGCASTRERLKRMESPGTYVPEWVSPCHFYLALCTLGPPSRALAVITWRGVRCRYMMRVGYTVKRAPLLKIKAQMSSIWAKECMLMIVGVCYLTWHDYPSLVEGESYCILLLNDRYHIRPKPRISLSTCYFK